MEKTSAGDLEEDLQKDVLYLANKYSLLGLKISSLNFDRVYELGQDNVFCLKSVKAVVRYMGRVTRVPIGEGEACQTFEEAELAVKLKWRAYYKRVRETMSDEAKARAAAHQRRYRAERRAAAKEALRGEVLAERDRRG